MPSLTSSIELTPAAASARPGIQQRTRAQVAVQQPRSRLHVDSGRLSLQQEQAGA